MATVKGTTVEFGIVSNATTGFQGEAIVTSASGGTRAETRQIKGSDGDAMSYVIYDESKEISVEVVLKSGCSIGGHTTSSACTSAGGTWTAGDVADLGTNGSVLTLSNFAGGTSDINGAYYLTASAVNYSNESEATASLTLLRLEDAVFTGSGNDLE